MLSTLTSPDQWQAAIIRVREMCFYLYNSLVMRRPVQEGDPLVVAQKFDFLILLMSAFFFYVLHITFRFFVSRVLFPFFFTVKTKADRSNADKFSTSAWELFFYSFGCIIGSVVVLREEWSWPPGQYWLGWPSKSHSEMRLDFQAYYAVECGYYVQGMVYIALGQERTVKDTRVMFWHHVVTLALILTSYFVCFTRVGTVIMLLHDVSDVFLHSAKLCKYSKFPGYFLDFGFVVFAISFFITRLYIYPQIIWSTIYTNYLPNPYQYNVADHIAIPFMIMLSSLQVIHIYWFSIIVRMVVKAIRAGKVSADDRSDSDDDDDDDDVKQAMKKKKK